MSLNPPSANRLETLLPMKPQLRALKGGKSASGSQPAVTTGAKKGASQQIRSDFSMQVIRPIRQSDFAALQQIAEESGHGFTSLPLCDDQLLAKIERAEQSLAKEVHKPEDESYLFVLEDSETGEIMGTTGIEAAVGVSSPLYHYRLSKSLHQSRKLGVRKTVSTLNLCNDYHGSSEICTLFLREDFRNGYAGRLLSKIRFLFMAQHPQRFADTIIAEMRGVSDEHGNSPFWSWLQEHFFDIDFATAVHLVGIGEKSFIDELMPKYPVYVDLLSAEAQAVIGKPHDNTVPAIRLLQSEGFQHKGYVDPFDAGPTVEAQLSDIHSVRNSRCCNFIIDDVSSEQGMMICNTQVENFRACYSFNARYDAQTRLLSISADIADKLLLKVGDKVRFVEA
jgi:arginine N-succinyltransferase